MSQPAPTAQIIHGDCIDVMRDLPVESVDAIITSPPYAEQRKSTYGGISERNYPEWTSAWMAEAWRVIKPSGSVLINLSPHIKNGQLADYTLRTRLALRDAGWSEVDELIWHKTNAMPTGSPRKPKRSWESIHWFAKHGQPYSDAKANGHPPIDPRAPRTKGNGAAIRNGWGHSIAGSNKRPEIVRCQNVFTGSKGSVQGVDHPAPFPWQLAEWCGKLICPPGGTILDPFSGSGSTGVAAIRNGWNYIGIDTVEEYVELSRRRLVDELGKNAA